jgi:hypothetical protein
MCWSSKNRRLCNCYRAGGRHWTTLTLLSSPALLKRAGIYPLYPFVPLRETGPLIFYQATKNLRVSVLGNHPYVCSYLHEYSPRVTNGSKLK